MLKSLIEKILEFNSLYTNQRTQKSNKKNKKVNKRED